MDFGVGLRDRLDNRQVQIQIIMRLALASYNAWVISRNSFTCAALAACHL